MFQCFKRDKFFSYNKSLKNRAVKAVDTIQCDKVNLLRLGRAFAGTEGGPRFDHVAFPAFYSS